MSSKSSCTFGIHGAVSRVGLGQRWDAVRAGALAGLVLVQLAVMAAGIGEASLTPAVGIGMVAFALPSCGWAARALSALFLAGGTLFLWRAGGSWTEAFAAFGTMVPVVVLFAVIPVLALPVQLGGYGHSVAALCRRRVRTPGQLYRAISGLSYFLSAVLNLATLPMVVAAVRDATRQYRIARPNRFLASGVLHGFVLPTLWSPVAPIVGFVLDQTGVSWLRLFPLLCGLSLLGLAWDWLRHAAGTRWGRRAAVYACTGADSGPDREAAACETAAAEAAGTGRPLWELALAVGLFLAAVSAASAAIGGGLTRTVAVLVLPAAAVWALAIGQGRGFWRVLREYARVKLPRMANQTAVFVSAGFFATCLQQAGVDASLGEAVRRIADAIGPSGALALVLATPMAFAYAGMHPIVTLTLLLPAFRPDVVGLAPELLAAALLCGAMATFVGGPFNATLGVMAALVNESPFALARRRLPFLVGFEVLAYAVLRLGA